MSREDDEITATGLAATIGDTEPALDLDLDLDPYDLNRAVLVASWGLDSLDWLATQHALDATPAAEREYRLHLAEPVTPQLAPVLPMTPRRAIEEQRAA